MKFINLFFAVIAALIVFSLLRNPVKNFLHSFKDNLRIKILWWYRNYMRKSIRNGDEFTYGDDKITVIDIGEKYSLCHIKYKGMVYYSPLENVFTWDKTLKTFVVAPFIENKVFNSRNFMGFGNDCPDWFNTIEAVKERLNVGDFIYGRQYGHNEDSCIRIESYDKDPNFFTFSFEGKKYRETIPTVIKAENGTFRVVFPVVVSYSWREVI